MKKFVASNDQVWVRNNQETIVAFERKLDELYNKAMRVLGEHANRLPRIRLYFKPLGMTLGYASQQLGGVIVMNSKAIDINALNSLNDTLPHEFAHIVCMFVPALRDNGHGANWKRVAAMLGAKPNATTNSDEYRGLTSMRKRSKFIYAVGGRELTVTKKYHEILQSGRTLRTKDNHQVCANNYVREVLK